VRGCVRRRGSGINNPASQKRRLVHLFLIFVPPFVVCRVLFESCSLLLKVFLVEAFYLLIYLLALSSRTEPNAGSLTYISRRPGIYLKVRLAHAHTYFYHFQFLQQPPKWQLSIYFYCRLLHIVRRPLRRLARRNGHLIP
jgi:hypothetical protein